MNPQTLDPVTNPTTAKTILSKDGFTCSLVMLAPGDETPRRDVDQVGEHVLYVADGEATVRLDQVNTILGKDQALLIPKGKQYVIAADHGSWVKILRLDVPPRQVVVPQIISFDRQADE